MPTVKHAEPRWHTEPTEGHGHRLKELAKVAKAIKLPLIPWSKRAFRSLTEFDPDTGEPIRRRKLITLPRQSGKSIAVGTVTIESMMRTPDSYGIYVAQTREAARNRLAGIATLLVRSGLDPLAKFTRGVGNERLLFSNGSVMEVVSPSATSVHGESIDLAIMDEVFAIEPIVLEAISPAMAARPNAELWMISTAGTFASTLLNREREKARDNPQGLTAFIEYSKPDELHALDEKSWKLFHPGIGHTTTARFLREESQTMPLPGFLRAYCNLTTAVAELAFPSEWWESSQRSADEIPKGVALSVEVTRLGGSIVAAWQLPDERWHAELLEYREGAEWAWLIEQAKEYAKRYEAEVVAYDTSGATASLQADLQALTDELVTPTLRKFTRSDRTKSDAWLYEQLRMGAFQHGPSEALDESVASTPAITVGEGKWIFGRKGAIIDPSPIVALSIALYSGYESEVLSPKPALHIFG